MTVAEVHAGLRVQIGFGVNAVGGQYFVLDDPVRGELDNTTYLLAPDTVFIDVTDYVASVSTRRGRERELDEYATGTATVVLNDTDRTFDPSYASGPYYGSITPMRRIRILWEELPLFTGWIDDWSTEYERGDTMSRVTLTCVDGFGILANQELDEIAAAFSGDDTGARISRVLNRAEVNFPASRNIEAGSSTLGDTTFGDNALAYLQNCARSEAGYLFVTSDGVLTFRNRTSALNTQADLTITDDPSGDLPYRRISLRSTSDLLYTRVTGQSETTSNALESVDTAAGNEFNVRTLPLGTLFTVDDNQTQNILDYYQQRFSAVEERFGAAEFATNTLTVDQVTALCALDLTSVVNVRRAPLAVGTDIEKLSIVDGIRHDITARGGWRTEMSFANADTRSFLVLDDANYGTLDANRLAF